METLTPKEKAAWEAQLDNWIDGQEALLVDMAARLMAIRSVREEALPGMPFGPGPAAALREGLAICREAGFAVSNYENFVGTVDLNEGERKLDILVHLDVVDAGSGWKTEPFQATLRDGLLIGRGAADDKGPAAAAILAMRALRETGVPLRSGARLILGTDEEAGFSDLRYYYAREPYAPNTFSPDAEFPLVNTEKGRFLLTASKQWAQPLPGGISARGGVASNVVPSDAEAVVKGCSGSQVREACVRAEAETGAKCSVAEGEDGFHIVVRGLNAHASTPEQGNNAITALIDLLCALPLAAGEAAGAFRALKALFPHGDHTGRACDIAMSDAEAGALTLAVTMFRMDETGLSLCADLRVPLCATQENCRKIIAARLEAAGLRMQGDMQSAHHIPADDPFVQTLLRCYERCTGETGYCISSGGNTYVHGIPGGVAFGCQMPGFQCNLHGAGEQIRIRDLLTASKIFARAIWEMCS